MNTAKIYNLKTSGKLDACEDCANAKEGQRNVNKEWLNSSIIPAERLYIDKSSIQHKVLDLLNFGYLFLMTTPIIVGVLS
jgi:hypothetical protein